MNTFNNIFIKKGIDKYGQDKLIESGIVLLENELEIKTLGDLAVQICCLTECKNCPVHIYKSDKRTEYERDCLYLCVTNLFRWIIEESNKVEE